MPTKPQPCSSKYSHSFNQRSLSTYYVSCIHSPRPGDTVENKTNKNPCSQGTDILGGRKSDSKLEIPKGLFTLNIIIYTYIE